MARTDAVLTRMREICLSLPGTKETMTWGKPHFRVGEKIFAGCGEENGRQVIGFKLQMAHAEAVIKFAVVAIAGLSLNTATMFAFTTTMQWHYLLSQVLATCVVLIWNFAANRAWTFVQRTPL